MKKARTIYLFLGIAIALSSCKEGAKTSKDIKSEEGKASYALGVNLGTALKQQGLKENQINDLIKGMEAYSKLGSEDEKTAFLVGVNVAKSIEDQKLTSYFDYSLIKEGASDYFKGDKNLKIKKEQVMQTLNDFAVKKNNEVKNNNKKESDKFLNDNKAKSGIITTASGLQYKVEKEGDKNTKIVNPYDSVKIKYIGKLKDGKEFDNSNNVNEGKPVTLTADRVIPGFSEGLKLMSKGAKYTLYIPPTLGYGEQGGGSKIGPNEVLIFEVEMIDVKKGIQPPPPPSMPGSQQQLTPTPSNINGK